MANSGAGRFFTTTGLPVSAPPVGYKLPDVMIDLSTHKVYQYSSSKWNEQPNFFGLTGSGKSITSTSIDPTGHLIVFYSDGTTSNLGVVVGANGSTPTMQTGNTTTLPYGQPAALSIRALSNNTYAVDAAIPQGKDGTGGGASVGFSCITPEQYYTGNWATAFQTAVTNACNTGAPLYTSGGYNLGNTVINFPKIFKKLTWKGNGAEITCGGFTRPRPVDSGESALQQNTKYDLADIAIFGNGSGTGLELAANSNSTLINITIESFTTAGTFRTMQHAYIASISMGNCINGLAFDVETNNGISAAATQSNDCKLFQPRFHSNLVCGTVITVRGSFGFQCWGLESEGLGSVLNVINFDDLGNGTVKSCRFYEPHFEHRGGIRSGGAFAKVKLNQGIFYISDPNHDVGELPNMYLIDATACAASSEIMLEDVNKWLYASGTKIFKGGQTHWSFKRGASIVQFSANNNPTVQANIQALFDAPVPKYYLDQYNNDPKVWGTNTFNWEMF